MYILITVDCVLQQRRRPW